MSQIQYETRGIGFGKPLAADVAREINAAIDRYSLVCFPESRWFVLTSQLGNSEPSHTSVGKTKYFGAIGNVQKDGTVLRN